MTASTYTLEDLQELDELCLEEALAMGLTPPPTMFSLVQAEEMYDIASRGLPGRYSHYRFGRDYEQQKGDYDRGKGRIYELVINTRPAHAYLMDGNSLIAQFFVIAHVYGHTDFFEHNRYFGPADKNILTRTRAAAERIDHYMGEYGREMVEEFIDAVTAFEYHAGWDQLAKKTLPKPPVWEDRPNPTLFPQEEAKRLAEFKEEKEAYKRKFPKEPVRDVLRFVEKNSHVLDDWQRDVISIIRAEAEYFVPQMRTQVMNEGWAVRAHNQIVQSIMAKNERFSTDDYLEYESSNARVLLPRIAMVPGDDGEPLVACTGINPYLLGSLMWKDIARICTDPTDDEKEKWPHWAGQVDPTEHCNEIMRVYDDRAFIAEFLTADLCERAKIFDAPRAREQYENLAIGKEEFEHLREILVYEKTTLNMPIIEITDANYCGRAELYLEHRVEGQLEEIGLDDEYARATLQLLALLWGRPVTVKTIHTRSDEVEDLWYRCINPTAGTTKTATKPT